MKLTLTMLAIMAATLLANIAHALPDQQKLIARNDESYVATEAGRSVNVGCRAVWASPAFFTVVATADGIRRTFRYRRSSGVMGLVGVDAVKNCDAPAATAPDDFVALFETPPQLLPLLKDVESNPQALLNALNDGPPLFQIAANEVQIAEWVRKREQSREEAVLNAQAERKAAQAKAMADQEKATADSNAAQRRFQAGVTAKKDIGVTVCSSDNRLAYVEGMAGPRLQLRIVGIAADSNLINPELRPYSMFTINPPRKIVRDPKVIWDLSSYWAVCDFREQ